jgi:hypothetical protein
LKVRSLMPANHAGRAGLTCAAGGLALDLGGGPTSRVD